MDIKPRRGGRVSYLIKAFDNPTTIYDPGADLEPAPVQAMSSIDGGGDKGGSGEEPTRPKPSVVGDLGLAQADRQLVLVASDADLNSNWDGQTGVGRNSGPEAMIGGEVNLEDEFCMEEEEEEVPQVQATPKVWRMLAQYYSFKAANYSVILEHFSEVWRIRGKMLFTPLKDNFFIITFNSEGDFNLWIKEGLGSMMVLHV
jgi:hypothetical protein